MEEATHAWEGPVEGYTVNFWASNFWRVERAMTWEDVMQESHLVFLKCARMYPTTGPSHFMSLYKTALSNRANDLSNSSTALRALCLDSELVRDDEDGEGASSSYETVALGRLVSSTHEFDHLLAYAPDDVREVLSLFVHAPPQILDAVFGEWRARGGKKANGNRFLCFAFGYDYNTVDLVTPCKEYLKG